MRTPYGKECRYYHRDFHRGRNLQECRLVKENHASERWRPQDCEHCTIPDILNANASSHLQLTLTIKTTLFGLRRQREITAFCTRHRMPIQDPYVGCQQCNDDNPALDLFRQALGQTDDD